MTELRKNEPIKHRVRRGPITTGTAVALAKAPVRRLARPGLDVDGVVAGFGAYVLEKLGLDPAKNLTYFFEQSYGPEIKDDIGRIASDPSTWINLPVLDGAKEAMRILLVENGIAQLTFVSDYHAEFDSLRNWWLQHRLGLKPEEYQLVRCKAARKSVHVVDLGLTHFIEDRPDTAAAIAQTGVESWLVPTTYMGTPPAGVIVGTVVDYARRIGRSYADDIDREFRAGFFEGYCGGTR